jgi:hypothetical protein
MQYSHCLRLILPSSDRVVPNKDPPAGLLLEPGPLTDTVLPREVGFAMPVVEFNELDELFTPPIDGDT